MANSAFSQPQIPNPLPVANGGTGGATAAAGMTNLLGRCFTASDAAPGSPTTDDLWYETDTNILWYWNGTYWLSVETFDWQTDCGSAGLAAGANIGHFSHEPVAGVQYDLYMLDLTATVQVATTNNGTHNWTFNWYVAGASRGSMGTSAISADTWTTIKSAINSYLDVSAAGGISCFNIVKNNTPGTLYGGIRGTFKLVHL